eukprot:7012500-Prymnesium_polylepis.1
MAQHQWAGSSTRAVCCAPGVGFDSCDRALVDMVLPTAVLDDAEAALAGAQRTAHVPLPAH